MKLLIIVDYQKDFVDGSLGFPGAELLEDKIISLIPNYDNYIITLDAHSEDYLNTLEGKLLPVKHTIDGTLGKELYGKLKGLEQKALKVFEKGAFGSIDLGNFLSKHPEYTEIDICGLVSHICVFSNAVIARSALPNSKVCVLKDYTDSYDKQLENKSFQVLNGIFVEVK